MVYLTSRNGARELWRADADGSGSAKLSGGAILGGVVCAPDSKSVMYTAENSIWRIPIEGGTPVKLNVPVALADFSWDGKLMVYGAQRFENGQIQSKIVVAPAEGGDPLYSFDAPYGLQQVRFAPDRKTIAFLLTRNGAANIWEQRLGESGPAQLTRFTSGDMFAFAWSKDGKQLAFSRGRSKTDVVMMNNLH